MLSKRHKTGTTIVLSIRIALHIHISIVSKADSKQRVSNKLLFLLTKKENTMKVETIIIKDFDEIIRELKEVLSKLGGFFAEREFFPL